MTAGIGIIGGSGLYKMQGARVLEVVDLPTPFGMPSDAITVVDLGGQPVAFLPRHGAGHRLLPSEIPSRANIWALKSLGVKQIISISAVGSLQEQYRPGDFVLCDQLVDRTAKRESTFLGSGVVGHVPFGDPICPTLRPALAKAMAGGGKQVHERGTLVVMEGPAFSTRAESELNRGWGASCIGMTALPEARLAREAEICYALVAMVTDYDCWHETEEAVTVEMVLKVMADNTQAIQGILPAVAAQAASIPQCSCREAARGIIVTQKDTIPYETRRKLALLYGKYWS